MTIPQVKKTNNRWELIVNGKPFTALAGEVHNSAASNPSYMSENVWPYLKGLHLNSIAIPVSWEQIEPKEKTYEFDNVDRLLNQARQAGVKVILLWFGLWKNGMSTYVPAWVKKDDQRFFRIKEVYGKSLDVVSPFCSEGVSCDSRAFSKLMEHLSKVDANQQTVILVQVENEIGVLGSDRDYSSNAQTIYEGMVPENLTVVYPESKGKTFEEAFGRQGAEILMEYGYATAVEQIAGEGKKSYALPMFVNAWLDKFPWIPGTYPSGGPIIRYKKLWSVLAPSICTLAPDLYAGDIAVQMDYYAKQDNPLLIPEIRRDAANVSAVFYAIGKYNALCYAPFGIEDFRKPEELLEGIMNPAIMKTLDIDAAAFCCTNTAKYLDKAYELLDSSMEMIRECQKENKIYAYLRRDENERGSVYHTLQYDVIIKYMRHQEDEPKAGGIILQTARDEFYLMGTASMISFETVTPGIRVGIELLEEGSMEQGTWIPGRILNGDERYFIRFYDMPQLLHVKLYTYQ